MTSVLVDSVSQCFLKTFLIFIFSITQLVCRINANRYNGLVRKCASITFEGQRAISKVLFEHSLHAHNKGACTRLNVSLVRLEFSKSIVSVL